MGENTKADVVSMRLAEGDKLTIEGLALDVLYTPGHTDDSYSFLMARPRVHRRHAADPRHRAHRFPERRRARAIRIAVRQTAAAARRDAGVSRARLQRRHRLHHRRGEALQSAPAGQVDRRLRRADGQPESAQPEDDGRRGAVQHEDRPGAAGDRAPRLGARRRRRRWRWSGGRTSPSSTCAKRASAQKHGSIPARCTRPMATCRTISAPAACCASWRAQATSASCSIAPSASARPWRCRPRRTPASSPRCTSKAASTPGRRPAARCVGATRDRSHLGYALSAKSGSGTAWSARAADGRRIPPARSPRRSARRP